MEFFWPGQTVRFKSRSLRGRYIVAGEDGSSVSLHRNSDIPNAAAAADVYIMFTSISGRYLAATAVATRSSVRVIQHSLEEPEEAMAGMWKAERRGLYVTLLRHRSGQYLRANSGIWSKAVTLDGQNTSEWFVEVVGRPLPPNAPPMPTDRLLAVNTSLKDKKAELKVITAQIKEAAARRHRIKKRLRLASKRAKNLIEREERERHLNSGWRVNLSVRSRCSFVDQLADCENQMDNLVAAKNALGRQIEACRQERNQLLRQMSPSSRP